MEIEKKFAPKTMSFKEAFLKGEIFRHMDGETIYMPLDDFSSQEYEAWEKLYNATVEYMKEYKEELLKQSEVFIKQLYDVANTPVSHRAHKYKVVEDD